MERHRELQARAQRRSRARLRVLLNLARGKLTKLKGVSEADPAQVKKLRDEVFDLEKKLKRRRHRSDPSVDGDGTDEVILTIQTPCWSLSSRYKCTSPFFSFQLCSPLLGRVEGVQMVIM
jgi:hypothetical protein